MFEIHSRRTLHELSSLYISQNVGWARFFLGSLKLKSKIHFINKEKNTNEPTSQNSP